MEWLILVVALAVVALTAVVGLVVPRRRRGPASGTDVLTPPPAAPEAAVSDVEAPPAPVETAEPAEPALDRPEDARSRLVRCGSGWPGARAASARVCSHCSAVSASTRTPGSRSRTCCSPPTSAWPPPSRWSRACAPGSASTAPRPATRARCSATICSSLLDPGIDRALRVSGDGAPGVVLVVGVNGSGKTTTVGKLARILVAEDRTVTLGAADTFRAAAVDQLATWGERVGVEVVRGPEGGDPASVAFEAVKHGTDAGIDTVVIDTAGRLQNKAGLMDELGKVKRVVEKQAPVTEVLLVLDATTGQNGLIQARVFSEVVDVTGIVLTKLDGSAKGGIVVAVQRELGVPVKLVGLGEGPDDLAPFSPEAFVDALLS